MAAVMYFTRNIDRYSSIPAASDRASERTELAMGMDLNLASRILIVRVSSPRSHVSQKRRDMGHPKYPGSGYGTSAAKAAQCWSLKSQR